VLCVHVHGVKGQNRKLIVNINSVITTIHESLFNLMQIFLFAVRRNVKEPILKELAVVIVLQIVLNSLIMVFTIIITEGRYHQSVREILFKSEGDFMHGVFQEFVIPCIEHVLWVIWHTMCDKVSRD
jgi:hypothetical protein